MRPKEMGPVTDPLGVIKQRGGICLFRNEQVRPCGNIFPSPQFSSHIFMFPFSSLTTVSALTSIPETHCAGTSEDSPAKMVTKQTE